VIYCIQARLRLKARAFTN